MSVNKVNSDGSLLRVAGGTFYADNPIGTILAFGGSNVPTGWHLCDGTALSRTTYKDLFSIIGTNFGVGDGSTTFNLPDLQGEFLRGAGTNGHSGQGSGGLVGEHQDATTHLVPIGVSTIGVYVAQNNELKNLIVNKDSEVGTPTGQRYCDTKSWDEASKPLYTSRPTNTSVNYIIKIFKTGTPADFDGQDIYSTTERRVGTWIDGKPVYEKVIDFGALPNNDNKSVDAGVPNLKMLVKLEFYATNGTATFPIPYYAVSNAQYSMQVSYETGNGIMVKTSVDRSAYTGVAIIRYTKTTD